MPDIQCLPSHVADLIAAGEVVERPASVAKELLENAIDAGASAIVVEIQHGGLTYLRIADNGCGIDAEQLPTAFLRHATSKLRTAADLAAIGTLGFRGEALAAISAVSRVDIFSRRTGAEAGASLHLEGGVPGQVEEVGCPEGTTICVRDLFYNTPARMKFMKKDSAEGAAVSGIVQHLALSHPEISFKLIRDGVELLHTPGDGDLQSAVYAAMGRDFAMGLLPISGCSGDISVEGFVTKPLNGHGTRGRQLFFVNGRFIKSQLLTAALEEAYRNQLLKGKFPGCVLRLTMPADRLDVNVHPAKTVVKFVNDKEAFNAVYYTVLDALNTPAPQPKKPRQESGAGAAAGGEEASGLLHRPARRTGLPAAGGSRCGPPKGGGFHRHLLRRQLSHHAPRRAGGTIGPGSTHAGEGRPRPGGAGAGDERSVPRRGGSCPAECSAADGGAGAPDPVASGRRGAADVHHLRGRPGKCMAHRQARRP